MSESAEQKWGIAHVYASFNNTLITITDQTGAETIVKSSGGSVVKQNRDEASPYAAMQMAETVAEQVKAAGLSGLHVRVRGPGGNGNKSPGPGAQATIERLPVQALRLVVLRTSHRFHTTEHAHRKTSESNEP